MKTLAINTAGPLVEVALINGDKTNFASDGFKKASESLFVFIDELLAGAKLELKDLDNILVVTGPGSFTGIRIGLTFARTVGQTLNKKIIPVTYHELLAYINKDVLQKIIITDAANGLYYVSEIGVDLCVKNYDQLKEFLAKNNWCLVVTEEKLKDKIAPLSQNILIAVDNKDNLVSAARDKTRKAITYKKIEPVYIRQSQAEEKSND